MIKEANHFIYIGTFPCRLIIYANEMFMRVTYLQKTNSCKYGRKARAPLSDSIVLYPASPIRAKKVL
jgi:hypothetical protein